MLVPLSRVEDELLAWNLGPLLLGQDKHGQKSDSLLSWALSERIIWQLIQGLDSSMNAPFVLWGLCDYAWEEKCSLVNIMAWPGEHSNKTLACARWP